MTTLFDLRPEERRYAWAGFASLFCVMAAHQQLETARDALFLASIPAERLPWMYIAIAAVATVISFVQRRLPERSSRDCRPVSGLLIFFAVATAGFFPLIDHERVEAVYIFYVWTSVMIALIIVRIWTLIGNAFTTTQARRVFPMVTIGSVLGAIAGTALARGVTSFAPASVLLLGGAATLLVAAFGAVPFLHGGDGDGARAERDTTARPRGAKRALREIAKIPYARIVVGLAVVGVLCGTFADYVFKSVTASTVPPDQLGEFFSSVYLATNTLSFLVQVFVAKRVIARFGAAPSVGVLPVFVFVGALTVGSGATLVGALMLAFASGTFEHSINRTATEILYIPFSAALRRRLKEALEIVIRNAGKAAASVALLVLAAFDVPVEWLAAITAGLALVWIGIAIRARNAYGEHFRDALREEVLHGVHAFGELDLRTAEEVMLTLSLPDEEIVVGALNHLDLDEVDQLVPPMILYHPALGVLDRALELYVQRRRTDLLPLFVQLLERETDPERRGRLLSACAQLGPDRALLERVLHDDCELCQSTAAVYLSANGWLEQRAADRLLVAVVRGGEVQARLSVARALGTIPAGFEALLGMLARDVNRNVSAAAIDAMSTRGELQGLLELVGTRVALPPVLRALRPHGADLAAPLAAAAGDPSMALSSRRRYLAALGSLDSDDATEALVAMLATEASGTIRYRIVRELEGHQHAKWLRRRGRGVLNELVDRLVDRVNASFPLALKLRDAVEQGGVRDEETIGLLELVVSRDAAHLETILRIQTLLAPRLDADALIYALGAGDPEQYSSAREIIDSLLQGKARMLLLSALTEIVDHASAPALPEASPMKLVAAIHGLLEHPSSDIREFAHRVARRFPAPADNPLARATWTGMFVR